MTGMHPTATLFRVALPLGVALALIACSSGGPGWTYAPLGPTPAPTATPSAVPTPGPSGSGGPGVTVEVTTTDADPLAFDPQTIDAPAATSLTVNYLNDSSLEHNIEFFAGSDQNAELVGGTERKTGPGDSQSVTFTTPAQPGDYFFWCVVHGAAMTGSLHVTQ